MTHRVIVLTILAAASTLAADVTGKWRVTISTPEGSMSGQAYVKLSGQAVTGWVGPTEDDPIPISGVLKGNKLTIETHPQPGRTVASLSAKLRVYPGKMTGMIDGDKGRIEFVK